MSVGTSARLLKNLGLINDSKQATGVGLKAVLNSLRAYYLAYMRKMSHNMRI